MALKPAALATLQFNAELHSRFLSLCEMHGRIRGTALTPPKSLDMDFLRWRRMAVRFKRGDYRNSEGEERSMLSIASWTLDVQCELIPSKKREKMPWE
jgi:hypothetical protein